MTDFGVMSSFYPLAVVRSRVGHLTFCILVYSAYKIENNYNFNSFGFEKYAYLKYIKFLEC